MQPAAINFKKDMWWEDSIKYKVFYAINTSFTEFSLKDFLKKYGIECVEVDGPYDVGPARIFSSSKICSAYVTINKINEIKLKFYNLIE